MNVSDPFVAKLLSLDREKWTGGVFPPVTIMMFGNLLFGLSLQFKPQNRLLLVVGLTLVLIGSGLWIARSVILRHRTRPSSTTKAS